MKPIKVTLTTVGAALLLSASANAAFVEFETDPAVDLSLNGVNTVTLPQFDTMGGTRSLTGVTLSLTYSMPSQDAGVINDFDQIASGTVTFDETQSFFNLAGTPTSTRSAGSELSSDFFAIGDQGPVNTGPLAPGESFSFPTMAQSISVADRAIDSDVWSQYTGTGNIEFTLITGYLANAELTSDGSGEATATLTLRSPTFFARVVYDYDELNAIPEPGTYGALAVACSIGFLIVRRRRKA